MLVEEVFFFFLKITLSYFVWLGVEGERRKEKHNFTRGASKSIKMWGMFLT